MNSSLGVAFIANNASDSLLLSSSADGTSWTPNTQVKQAGKASPCLVFFKNQFWICFVADNASNTILICSSPDGVNWSNNQRIGQTSKTAPSLVVFNNQLWIAFVADNASNSLLVCSSADGTHWSNNLAVGQASRFSPSLAVFNNRLYLGFVANNATSSVLICSSTDGTHWSNNTLVGQASKTAVSLATMNNHLWVALVANNASNALLVCSSADGTNWSPNTPVAQASQAAPSLTAFNNHLWLGFIANNASGDILVCSSADGVHWSSNTRVGQTSKYAPSLAQKVQYTGTLRPAYKVLTLIYAPPGTNGGKSASLVDYGNGSSTGTSTSTSSSFKAGVDVTVSVGFPGVASASSDFSFSNTSTNTSSLDVKKTEMRDIKVFGPGTDGIDHDQDLFYLWLNPLVNLTMDASGNVTWYLSNDGSFMNIQYVSVTWLKNPQSMPVGVKQQLDAVGMTTADYAAILALNPFAFNQKASIDPNRYLLTTQSFPYEAPASGAAPIQLQTLQVQNMVTQTASHQNQIQYGVTVSASAQFADIWSVSVKGTFQWTDTSTLGTSSGTTQSASVTIGPPAPGFTGSSDILVYWDTLYNSFMFAYAPLPPSIFNASEKALPYQPVALTAAGLNFTTIARADGSYRFFGAPLGQARLNIGGRSIPTTVTAQL